jgi:hypothetical protein
MSIKFDIGFSDKTQFINNAGEYTYHLYDNGKSSNGPYHHTFCTMASAPAPSRDGILRVAHLIALIWMQINTREKL